MEQDHPIEGRATLRVRNLVIEDVRVTWYPTGDIEVPSFALSDFHFFAEDGGSVNRNK